jgi:hypothetical protein
MEYDSKSSCKDFVRLKVLQKRGLSSLLYLQVPDLGMKVKRVAQMHILMKSCCRNAGNMDTNYQLNPSSTKVVAANHDFHWHFGHR